jgi:large subunit ribosomal protein L17
MKKKVFGRKLSRERSSRQALFLSLVESLILNGKIVTTKAKAKSIIPDIDKLIVLAKKDTLAAKRQVLARLHGNKTAASSLWSDYAALFKDRSSGFTTMMSLPQRVGDRAEMVKMEFIGKLDVKEKLSPKKEKESKSKEKTEESKK